MTGKIESDTMPKITQYIPCLRCGGRGYRVKWTNGRGRTTNCTRCHGAGSNRATDWSTKA